MTDILPIAIPGYDIISLLGKGAMGTVYKARQVRLERLVAIKVVHTKFTSDRQYLARFLREASAAGRLSHINVVAIHDVGQCGSDCYMVIEYVDGESLQAMLLRLGRLDEEQALRIVLQVARALQHAHEHGIVHRDVKPANILIAKDGVAKLCDFGLARPTERGYTLTQGAVCLGTPLYMAPEQGGKDLDIRADIYSLGATLYHLVTGEPPFDGPNLFAILSKHVMEPVPAPRTRRPELSEWVEGIILRAMEKETLRRFPTPGSMAEAIEHAIAVRSLPVAASPTRPSRASTPVPLRRSPSSTEERTRLALEQREANRKRARRIAAIGLPILAVVVSTLAYASRRSAAAAAHEQAVSSATKLIEQKKWTRALAFIENELRQYPADASLDAERAQVKEQLAKIQESLSRADDAFEKKDFLVAKAGYEDALVLDPTDDQARRRYEEVVALLYRLEQSIAKGDRLLKDGDAQGALSSYNDALAVCPTNLRVFTGVEEARERIAGRMGSPDDAVAPHGTQSPPGETVAVLYDEAVHRKSETRETWEEALTTIERALSIDPVCGAAWHERGVLHEKLGMGNDALTDYARAIQAGSFIAEAHYARGRILFDELNSPMQARAEFEAVVRMSGDDACVLGARARMSLADGDLAGAVRLAKQVLGHTWLFDDAFCVLGLAYSSQPVPDFDQSIECLGRAIQLDPSRWATWSSRSAVHCAKKEYSEALADAERAIEMSNSSPLALQRRAWSLIGLRRFDDAVRQYDDLEKKHGPLMASLLRDRGTCNQTWSNDLKNAGDDSGAKAHLRSAISDWEVCVKLIPAGSDREAVESALSTARATLELWR